MIARDRMEADDGAALNALSHFRPNFVDINLLVLKKSIFVCTLKKMSHHVKYDTKD